MQIHVDGALTDVQAETLGQAIAAVRDRLSGAGGDRVIVEVQLDGRTLGEDDLAQRHDQPLGEALLAVVTAESHELARQTLLDVGEALAAARDRQHQAADLLRSDQPQEALDHVKSALATWQQAQQSVQQSAQLLDIDLDQLTIGGRPAAEIVEELARSLRAVREQLVGTDWIGLADALAYDLDDAADTWTGLLDALADHIRSLKPDA
ncbi:MAG: hypothetical protein GVY27_06990 [Deinococcus-Thermus bacterium]|jgi:hypothetical protein|nr:hypothetical protein [Deinococcota bacterium]